MPSRSFSVRSQYRYGFNGQEKSDELDADGNLNTALFWEYEGRLGRRWNVDPLVNTSVSSYNCFLGNPILLVDRLGNVVEVGKDSEGKKKNIEKATDAFVKDLRAKRGLDLPIENGELKSNRVLINVGISLKVRKELLDNIGSTDVVSVDFTDKEKTLVPNGNHKSIMLSYKSINYMIAHTSSDLDNTTLGYAMTYFHEIFHTTLHNKMSHNAVDLNQNGTIDAPDIFGNEIRNELSKGTGKNYGQRMAYTALSNQFKSGKGFVLFSTSAKDVYDTLLGQWKIYYSGALTPDQMKKQIKAIKAIKIPILEL